MDTFVFGGNRAHTMPLRVAAYCRVSTDRTDQAHSLSSQQHYFRDYIQNHEGWVLEEVYADEGLSGTNTKNRKAFHRMIYAAEIGQLDLILTKEVSRFARNTVDTLEYTRKLKQWGVGVLFISDHIDTRDNDGELRLTIMASMAQEESRKTSERVKWGQKRQMEAGVVFGNNSTYGFDTKAGRLFIKQEQADVVRLIYHKYLAEGKGTHVIARELYEQGIMPPRSETGRWSGAMVLRILRNEKYVGDLLQKKFITVDYLSHKKEPNKGREEQIYLRDHHEAVIDRQTWEQAQAELLRRSAVQGDKTRYSNRYWCSGKIFCGSCGSRFVPRSSKRRDGTVYKIWGCRCRVCDGSRKKDVHGNRIGCDMHMVNDKSLKACAQYVLQALPIDHNALAASLVSDLDRVCQQEQVCGGPVRTETQIADLKARKERVMDAYFGQMISMQEMLQMKARYDAELERLERRLREQPKPICGERMIEAAVYHWRDMETVLAEIIEKITVYEQCMELGVKHYPLSFRIWYSTSGSGSCYTTRVDKVETSARHTGSLK